MQRTLGSARCAKKAGRRKYHERDPSRSYAQITCQIDAAISFTVQDAAGEVLVRSGTQDEPFELSDMWVFERCVSAPVETAAWQLKARILDSAQQSSAVRLANLNNQGNKGSKSARPASAPPQGSPQKKTKRTRRR